MRIGECSFALQQLEQRVLLAGDEVTLSFQQGINGYLGTQDTYVNSLDPATPFGSATSNLVENEDPAHTQALIRFDQLFGDAAGQIPAGATITTATLTIYTGNSSGDESTTSSSLYQMLTGWSVGSTWNSLGGGVSADGTEAASTSDGTVTPSVVSAPVSFNVTATLQAWLDNPTNNFGWALIGNGTNLWKWSSAEKSDVTRRPMLTVSYVPSGAPVNRAPIVSAGNDAQITLPTSSVSLNGTVTDDGLPDGSSVTTLWSEISGPGAVAFGDATSVDTTASFSAAGTYVLRLTASDGERSSSDDVTITVNPAPPPTQLLNPVQLTSDTAEKPQAKVWKHAGSWWGVFPKNDGTWVWRLDGVTWKAVLKINSATNTRADVKPVGDVAHVLMFTGINSKLASVEYVSGSPGTYRLWTVRPSILTVTFTSGVETATIDIDGDGRMWAASEGTSTIEARYSEYPYSTWSPPIVLASNVNSDDISAIKAFPDGSVGVLWSNQTARRFGFRRHLPGADPTSWTANEVPASQSALNIGAGMADDHLSMAVGSDGTLYAAVKTGYDRAGYPAIALLIRRPDGTWDDLYTVDTAGTRGIVVLEESTSSLMIVYSFTDGSGSGDIVYRKSSVSHISFGPRTTLMTGSPLNNASSTKQVTEGEIVIVAADTSRRLFGVRVSHPPPPAAPTSLFSGMKIADGNLGFDEDELLIIL